MNQASFTLYFLLAIAIADFIVGLFVLLKNPRRLVNVSFFTFALGIAAWSAGVALIFKTHSFFYNQVIFYGALIMFGGLLLFSRVFPEKDEVGKRFWFWLVPLGLLAWAIPWKVFVSGVTFSASGSLEPVNGPGMPVFAVTVLAYMLYSIYLLVRTYRHSTGLRKMQMQYLFLGLSLFIFSAVIFDAILPAFGVFAFNLLGPGSSVFLVAFTAYAIVRHQLLDIDVVIRRGTVFTLLFGSMITILVASTSILSSIFPYQVSQLITAFLLTVLFIPTKNILERVTDRVFFRRGYHLDEALSSLNHILIRTINLDELSKTILEHIGNTIKVSKAMMFIAESQEEFTLRGSYGQTSQLQKLDNESRLIRYLQSYPLLQETHQKEILTIHDPLPEGEGSTTQVAYDQWQIVTQEMMRLGFVLVMPIFAKRKLIGVVLLGEKKSGDEFSNQDMSFLDLASHEVAFSIENGLNIERLMRVDEVKSEFITVVSHQLRTPLSVARWNFELLLSGAFGDIPKKIREIIEGTHVAMMDLNQGVNNLMTSLEIEEGKVVTHFEETQLSDIIDEAINGTQQEAEAKQVTIERDFGYSGSLSIDRHKIQRVLEIILDNAIRYSQPKAKVIFKNEVISEDQPEPELKVSVEDFGIGIDPKNYEVIFQKFFRGEEAKKASPGGFGLGMFISKAYIELHGGKIAFQPKEGPGTIIYFTIPLRHGPNRLETQAASVQTP